MTVNPILLEAFTKVADQLFLVGQLAKHIKDGNFPPKGMPTEMFPQYTMFGLKVTEAALREAIVLSCTM